jgi:hypothetical protein
MLLGMRMMESRLRQFISHFSQLFLGCAELLKILLPNGIRRPGRVTHALYAGY